MHVVCVLCLLDLIDCYLIGVDQAKELVTVRV